MFKGILLLALFFFIVLAQIAFTQDSDYQFDQDAIKSVLVVDEDGVEIEEPVIGFGSQFFSNDPHDAYGILGDPNPDNDSPISQPSSVRVYNPGKDTELTVSLAANMDFYDSFEQVSWVSDNSESDSYPIQANELYDGQLSVNPSNAFIRSVTGCSIDNPDIALGGQTSFYYDKNDFENNVESIDLLVGDGNVNNCIYDVQGIEMHQTIPRSQPVGVYILQMLLTVT